MSRITSLHFGGNLILTNDRPVAGSAFDDMLDEIGFSAFRYPGGGITEAQTWANGGLQRIFGPPMSPDADNYVFTLREALSFAEASDTGLTLVIPTFQFASPDGAEFDHTGFGKYLTHLEQAISEYPGARIADLEIGNEYWGSLQFDAMSAAEYGAVANAEIPLLHDMAQRLAAAHPEWQLPGIGIQAGAAWRATGPEESRDIALELDPEVRGLVTTIFQHSYPDMSRNDTGWQQEWAIDPMKVFSGIPGFRPDLKLAISEFNIAANSATGVAQGAAWIEEFAAHIDAGVDEFHHWGLAYNWLSNKFYDTRFPEKSSEGGEVLAHATPMGQVYDLAETHLVGKSTLTDQQAVAGLDLPEGFGVTGFADATQRVTFLHNGTDDPGRVDLGGVPAGNHLAIHHLVPADSPLTQQDESTPLPAAPGGIVDARGDMQVQAGFGPVDPITLGPGEMAVVIISDPDRDLEIEGAHHVTDDRSGMVDDVIRGGRGDDILRGHAGDDRLEGDAGRDVIRGGKGDDLIRGGKGGDVIETGQGRDRVEAGEGDDLIAINSGKAGDRTEIATGAGKDLILTSAGQQVHVTDFDAGDRLGFDGLFADAKELAGASRIEEDDLLISLGDGGELRLAGAATRTDDLHSQVVDFQQQGPDRLDELGNTVFDGLSGDQIVETYDLLGSIDGLNDHDGAGIRYWDELDQTLAQAGTPIPPDDAKNPAGPADQPPSVPREPEPEPKPGDEDEQDPHTAAGGACFVATAAYGDRLHPDVRALRDFRDRHLIRWRVGRGFVRVYWIIGPIMARRTRPGHLHARMIRRLLSLLVRALRSCGLAT
jgi:hypothetical protein